MRLVPWPWRRPALCSAAGTEPLHSALPWTPCGAESPLSGWDTHTHNKALRPQTNTKSSIMCHSTRYKLLHELCCTAYCTRRRSYSHIFSTLSGKKCHLLIVQYWECTACHPIKRKKSIWSIFLISETIFFFFCVYLIRIKTDGSWFRLNSYFSQGITVLICFLNWQNQNMNHVIVNCWFCNREKKKSYQVICFCI